MGLFPKMCDASEQCKRLRGVSQYIRMCPKCKITGCLASHDCKNKILSNARCVKCRELYNWPSRDLIEVR